MSTVHLETTMSVADTDSDTVPDSMPAKSTLHCLPTEVLERVLLFSDPRDVSVWLNA